MKQICNAVRSFLLVLLLLGPSAFAASAGTPNESAKPPLYTFVVSLDIPRVHWGAMGRANEGMDKPQDASMQEGMIVGFGSNATLTHDPKRLPTHERWCSGMSVASVLNAIDALGRSGAPNDPAVLTQTNRWDAIYVSRFYNWRAGTYRNAWMHKGVYKLSEGAPPNTVEVLGKNVMAPLLEKLLAEGIVVAYQIETEFYRVHDSRVFRVNYVTEDAAGLDKVAARLAEASRADPLAAQLWAASVNLDESNQYLFRTSVAYKSEPARR